VATPSVDPDEAFAVVRRLAGQGRATTPHDVANELGLDHSFTEAEAITGAEAVLEELRSAGRVRRWEAFAYWTADPARGTRVTVYLPASSVD
jgi:hypothetical protein